MKRTRTRRDNTHNRKRLSDSARREVYDKCGGHCAYCGCELDFESMQIDHVRPLSWYGADELYNMLPACHICNRLKADKTLDSFRRYLENLPNTLAQYSMTYRNAARFGLVGVKSEKVTFYFETLNIEI